MSPRLRSLVLLAVLLWQGLVGLTPVSIEWRADELAHLQVHGQDVDHHHHDDRSLHLEADADASTHHHHAAAGAQPAGLVPGLPGGVVDPAPAIRVPVVRTGHATFVAEGLLRPPQAGPLGA